MLLVCSFVCVSSAALPTSSPPFFASLPLPPLPSACLVQCPRVTAHYSCVSAHPLCWHNHRWRQGQAATARPPPRLPLPPPSWGLPKARAPATRLSPQACPCNFDATEPVTKGAGVLSYMRLAGGRQQRARAIGKGGCLKGVCKAVVAKRWPARGLDMWKAGEGTCDNLGAKTRAPRGSVTCAHAHVRYRLRRLAARVSTGAAKCGELAGWAARVAGGGGALFEGMKAVRLVPLLTRQLPRRELYCAAVPGC
ncbi:MAG: hypothetical protein J3K34DRAFT_206227 [Monoraphidium minutum]|nr:MAG: hypothetical protein J3K34DRAFT_206227 [Monoraphidium minutum]